MQTLTEATIRQYADSRSFARGVEYYREGAVITLERRGDMLQAEVEGNGPEPYAVTVTFTPNGDVEAECDCPYEGWGWCKHIMAVLLSYLSEPEDVEELPALETLLSPLDRNALQTLLLNLARGKPEWTAAIELEIASLDRQQAQRSPLPSAETPSAAPLRVPVNVATLRRQVRTALKSVTDGGNYNYWDDDDYGRVADLEEGIYPLIETAEAFLQAGDGRGALPVLEAITVSSR